jgi:glycerol-3-phosphate dehydrogenase
LSVLICAAVHAIVRALAPAGGDLGQVANSARQTTFDLAIIGGGINGCGIARDAAGRGLSVFLCEKGDLGGATSSASTKLIHGGLRYLEYYEFRLVREALAEREVLLHAAPTSSGPSGSCCPIPRTFGPPG